MSMKAVAILQGDKTSGTVWFTQASADAPVMIVADINGLSDGLHGFHCHQFGDRTNGCMSAGGHFNPMGTNHGGLTGERHAGDWGNITSAGGKAHLELEMGGITLGDGSMSILARSVVVHEGEDDLGLGGFEDSLKTGHAGARACCGVVGRAKAD